MQALVARRLHHRAQAQGLQEVAYAQGHHGALDGGGGGVRVEVELESVLLEAGFDRVEDASTEVTDRHPRSGGKTSSCLGSAWSSEPMPAEIADR